MYWIYVLIIFLLLDIIILLVAKILDKRGNNEN